MVVIVRMLYSVCVIELYWIIGHDATNQNDAHTHTHSLYWKTKTTNMENLLFGYLDNNINLNLENLILDFWLAFGPFSTV